MAIPEYLNVGIMVAHPDDEILWAGGAMLLHPEWRCQIWTLCRKHDADRAPRFRTVLERLSASGEMADLDDGPEQQPLSECTVEQVVQAMAGVEQYDLFLTHGPLGEYTRHLRHEETSRAVMALWQCGVLRARELWLFAYQDGDRAYLPRVREDAHLRVELPETAWQEKYHLIHALYGFAADSWEARATPRTEGFYRFTSPEELLHWYETQRS